MLCIKVKKITDNNRLYEDSAHFGPSPVNRRLNYAGVGLQMIIENVKNVPIITGYDCGLNNRLFPTKLGGIHAEIAPEVHVPLNEHFSIDTIHPKV